MCIVTQIIKKVNTVFEPNFLKTLAQETKFIRRERVIKPKEFLVHHLFLELEEGPNSLTDVLIEFNKDNISLTKQGLNKRYTQEACDFFQRVLEELINFSTQERSVLNSIPFVKNIKVADSSTIRLNKQLAQVFPGLRNHGATLKLQAAMNVVTNQLHSLELRPSRENDQSYTKYLDCIEKEDLSINDLGYFCIDSFKKIEEKGAFFLSRFLKSTNVYHADPHMGGDKIELAPVLETTKKNRVELNILLGKSKFKCRLVALRLPPKAYNQRIKNLQEKQRKNGHSKTKSTIFDKWTIFVTNLPDSINADTLLTLYGLRWQIELFFKMAKTVLNLRKINYTNAYRSLISLYVSLIAIAVLGLISMTITHKELSFYKAGKILKKNIRAFFDLINTKSNAIAWLAQKITAFALKETRPNRPSTRRKLSRGTSF